MRFLIHTVGVLAIGLISGCAPSSDSGSPSSAVVDGPIETYQKELLELAFSGVSDMPLSPHIKNRSRAQLKVLDAALELDQPTLALEYVEEIENWQRWMGYANLAVWYAEQEYPENARLMLDKVVPALTMSEDIRKGKVVASVENPLIDSLEDWRYEAVLTRAEEARRIIGSSEGQVPVSEQRFGAVNAANLNVESISEDNASIEEAFAALEPFLAQANFEIIYLGLQEMVEVISEHYSEIDLLSLIDTKVEPRIKKIPVFLRISIYESFAEVSISNDDGVAIPLLMKELDAMVSSLKSQPRYYIPEMVKVIRLRQQLGELETAREALDSLRDYYVEKRDLIVNIERAALVCNLAESYQLLGEELTVAELYLEAITQGQVNPNSRPRADDLNRICCSMAKNRFEPDAELWIKLREMRAKLQDPW